jgi:hypothetical protein
MRGAGMSSRCGLVDAVKGYAVNVDDSAVYSVAAIVNDRRFSALSPDVAGKSVRLRLSIKRFSQRLIKKAHKFGV